MATVEALRESALSLVDGLGRMHQWTILEGSVLFVALICLFYLLVTLVEAVFDRCLAAWKRRAIQRVAQGGVHGYADPARVHRETAREVDRLANGVSGPQHRSSVAELATRQGSAHRFRTSAEGVGPTDVASDPNPPPTPSERHVGGDCLDQTAGYGTSTTLVFPASAHPAKRVNGGGHVA